MPGSVDTAGSIRKGNRKGKSEDAGALFLQDSGQIRRKERTERAERRRREHRAGMEWRREGFGIWQPPATAGGGETNQESEKRTEGEKTKFSCFIFR